MSAVGPSVSVAQVAVGVGVALLAGACYRRGTGLRPVALAAWAAPLPLLVFAARSPLLVAVGAAAVAWLIGQLGLWRYYTKDVRLPRLLIAAHFIGGASLVATAVAMTRAQLISGHLMAAELTMPVAWAAMEYLVSLRSPHGAWWSIAYSQADRPIIVRIASLTGVWGVSALVVTPAAALAAASAPVGTGVERLAAVLVGAIIVLLAYGYGRTRRVPAGDPVRVGLAVVPHTGPPTPVDSPDGSMLLARYIALVRQLAGRGAEVVVLPEAVFAVPQLGFTQQLHPFADAAAELGVQIVVGVIRHSQQDGSANVAAIFRSDARPPVVYAKQHLVPGLEAAHRPGREPLYVQVGATRAGVAICKDLDFPSLGRGYRQGGAKLLLAPAWDFGCDGWLHSRMAVFRGVESGIAVVRAARGGRATVSDAAGRIVAEATTVAPAGVLADIALDAQVRSATKATIYARFGDWFAWCCLAATTLLAVIG
jgi:apolipoprotein N-acyltransferase